MSTKVKVTVILPSSSKLCSEIRIRKHLTDALSAAYEKTASPLDKQLLDAIRVGCVKVEPSRDEEEDE